MLLLILILGFILRVISLDQSLWLDEAINVLATRNFSFLGMVTEYAKADFHPPGYFIILWIWTKLFGIGEVWVRIPSVIFGLLTIYIVYLIGKKLHSKTLGLLSALLLAINPLHIYYSQEARMYALATLAVSINFFLLIKLIKKEKLSIIFLIFSNLLVLASDYVAYFIFPSQAFFLLFFKQKEFIKKWLLALSVATALGIWWIPTFLNQLDVGSLASSRLPAWKLIVGAFDPKAIPLTFVKFIIGRISLADKMVYAAVLLPISLLFLALCWRGIKFIGKLGRNLLITWISIPIILATLISLVIPIYSYFRLQFILPAFVILTSLGIISFKFKLRYTVLIIVVLIELFSSSIYLLNPAYQREDWRGLVNFLKLKVEATTLFESSGTLPPFDYYARGEINAKGALKDFPAKDMDGVEDLEKPLQGSKDIYLIEYLVEIADPQRLVEKSLDGLGYKKIETINFNGVGFVYHYIKNE